MKKLFMVMIAVMFTINITAQEREWTTLGEYIYYFADSSMSFCTDYNAKLVVNDELIAVFKTFDKLAIYCNNTQLTKVEEVVDTISGYVFAFFYSSFLDISEIWVKYEDGKFVKLSWRNCKEVIGIGNFSKIITTLRDDKMKYLTNYNKSVRKLQQDVDSIIATNIL